MVTSFTKRLPEQLYSVAQVRELDRIAIEEEGVAGIELMRSAGQAAFELLNMAWPNRKNILVVCGLGNNAGDGYVLARLAQEAGMQVQILQMGNANKLKGDAKISYDDLIAITPSVVFSHLQSTDFSSFDIIVDALFGSGLDRDVEGEWQGLIESINQSQRDVLSLDIPSGLNADKGNIMGGAIVANKTISFIGLKQGLFTSMGRDYSGDVYFSNLAVPERVYKTLGPAASQRIDYGNTRIFLNRRKATAHKGDFGHVLTIGGDHGYMGAACLASEAAAKVGAGLLSIASRASHVTLMSIRQAELMCHAVESVADLTPLLNKASVIAIGPGLGQSPWAIKLFSRILQSSLPQVLDADALNLLAKDPHYCQHWILTPHPGEAARLLDSDVVDIQVDRFAAAKALQKKYGGVIVLKGSGTLVVNMENEVSLCCDGNPGMATGGMGDILTGVIAGLLAQGLELGQAAKLGVCLHAKAADKAAEFGERGLLASDLLPFIRELAN